MPSANHLVTRLITVRYYIALGLIAVFVTASFLILGQVIETQGGRFDVIEVAAKQRLSSQRIAFLSNALVIATDLESRQRYRDALRRTVQEMKERHEILSHYSDESGIPRGMRTILQDIFHSGLQPFDGQVVSFFRNADEILKTKDDDIHADLSDLVKLNFNAERILQTYELIVRLLRMEAIDAVNEIHRLDLLIWILILLLLAAEIPLIFRPMARRAAASLDRIESARRKAEREAVEAEAAREGQASFIRTMSHELRTPLNAILGMAQLLRMKGLSRKQDGYVQDIHQAGQTLLELINGILEFSRLEAGQVKIDPVPNSLEDQLTRAVSLCRPLARKKGLELYCRVASELSTCYRFDGPRVRQVLSNIIGNSIKFTERGSIQVRAVLAGRAGPNTDLVCIEVEDKGIGIAQEMHERIFEEFQQADTSLARKFGGSGLGLSICKRLVHLMGGEIGVQSSEGDGSLFWFQLPLERVTTSDLHERAVSATDELKEAG